MSPEEEKRPDVAILVDFENLALGLQRRAGRLKDRGHSQGSGSRNNGGRKNDGRKVDGRSDRGVDRPEFDVDMERIVRFAAEFGDIAYMRAYADWRLKVFNQWQIDLDRAGFDIVHVFGTGATDNERRKNASDMRIAVDAVESIWTFPHVKTYLIVSGDRDFVCVLKALRRYGKRVIGVGVEGGTSADFASLCDRFRHYSKIEATSDEHEEVAEASTEETVGLEAIRELLVDLLTGNPEGVLGSPLKVQVRREIPTFDEADYGADSFGKFLRQQADLLDVRSPGADESDIRVFLKRTGGKSSNAKVDQASKTQRQTELVSRADLGAYRFIRRPERRLVAMQWLYPLLSGEYGFSMAGLVADLAADPDGPFPSTRALSMSMQLLRKGAAYRLAPNQADVPGAERTILLADGIDSAESLLDRYEAAIVFVAQEHLSGGLSTMDLCELLGLDPRSKDDNQRVAALDKMARARIKAAEQQGTAANPEQAGESGA